MEYILTPKEMKIVDSIAINDFCIPSALLMENAARSASDFIRKKIIDLELIDPKIAILCGSGNNGGDGFALARHLFSHTSLNVYWIGDESKMSLETKSNYSSIKKITKNLFHIKSEKDLTLLNSEIDIIINIVG